MNKKNAGRPGKKNRVSKSPDGHARWASLDKYPSPTEPDSLGSHQGRRCRHKTGEKARNSGNQLQHPLLLQRKKNCRPLFARSRFQGPLLTRPGCHQRGGSQPHYDRGQPFCRDKERRARTKSNCYVCGRIRRLGKYFILINHESLQVVVLA